MFTNGATVYPFFVVVLIPIFLKIIHPLFQRYIPSILKRIGIGLCLITVSLLCSLLVDTIGHALPSGKDATSVFNSVIYYYENNSVVEYTSSSCLQLSPYILITQNFLIAVAYILIYGGVFEFISAQSPHSMKGVLIGIFYAVKGLFQLIGVLICSAKLLYPILFKMLTPNSGKEHRLPFRRFEEECQVLSRINHPNIVQYLGTYRDPETNAPVLLMERMDESLTHFLESSPGDILYHIQVNLSQDIAQALAFLHANGIIHRDLSSNNVLLIASSRAKVTDFGMSKFTDLNATRLATLTQCPGTPVFMSPEALDEPPVYTEKLDNFSFGVLLAQIITRQFPSPGDRFETVLIPSPRDPTNKVKSRVAIPEVERRQAHISLIDPTHPLLSIALECLKDEAVERPSSEQLCQSLDALKRIVKYKKSFQQGTSGLLQEKKATVQGTTLNTQDSKELRLSWKTLPTAPVTSFEHASAVVGEKAYFKSARSVWEYNSTSQQWNQLPEHPLWGFSLVSVENELVTVGGFYKNKLKVMKFSNKLFSYVEGKWVEKYPPIPTKRWENLTNNGIGSNRCHLLVVSFLCPFVDYMYMHDAQPDSKFSVVRCSLLSLVIY